MTYQAARPEKFFIRRWINVTTSVINCRPGFLTGRVHKRMEVQKVSMPNPVGSGLNQRLESTTNHRERQAQKFVIFITEEVLDHCQSALVFGQRNTKSRNLSQILIKPGVELHLTGGGA